MAKKKKGNTKRSKMVRVTARGLFNQSDTLLEFAENVVLKRFAGTPNEKKDLKKFIGRIKTIQRKIAESCRVVKGGNPMFHDFRIKSRG
jgi:hypothetical protein